MAVEADLIAYYEAEARGRRRVGLDEFRNDLLDRFAAKVRRARPCRVVDVGSGPGLDTQRWSDAGFEVVGVDLVQANVELIGERGLAGVTASLYQLPFRAGAFEALWTMSTFVHVPDTRFNASIAEMLRVVRPGARLGIGTWGGLDMEGVPEFGDLRPYRFFSLRSHDRWRQMLAEHGWLEEFETFESIGVDGWEYQFAVLRAPA